MTAAQVSQPVGLVVAPRSPLARRLVGPAVFAGVLVVLGALLGLIWAWWSPLGPPAAFLPAGTEPLDESESFVQADGRFLVIGAVVGLVAGFVAWRMTQRRGPLMPIALGAGGVLGSLAMWWVGHLAGGGDGTGRKAELTDGSTVRVTNHLPLDVHMHGVLFVEAALAVLVYGLFASFTARDDLGHPDPRDRGSVPALPLSPAYPPPAYPPAADPPSPRPRPRPGAGGSVDAGGQPQRGGGDGDAPGAAQQGDLPPQ